jgi:hypothetical protein
MSPSPRSQTDTSPSTSTLIPLAADDGRYFLSMYALASSGASAQWAALVPCSSSGGATSAEPATVIGVRREARGVVSYKLPLMQSIPITKTDAPQLKQLVQSFVNTSQRMGGAGGAAAVVAKPVQRATATYDIVGAADAADMSSVAVHFEWVDPPAVFAPPPYSASSVMRARILAGDSEAPSSWLYVLHHSSFLFNLLTWE